MNDTKICTCCKKRLPNYEFGRSSASKDGVQNRCYSCNREAFYKNKEKVRQQTLAEQERRKQEAGTQVLRVTNASSREPYNPNTGYFYRNDGHKHLLSRGISC